MKKDKDLSLTLRQKEAAELLLRGLGNQEIADGLQVTLTTVKRMMDRLFRKFGLKWGIKRIRLAVMLHEKRQELGISCVCDSPKMM